jgi:competence protein ComFC
MLQRARQDINFAAHVLFSSIGNLLFPPLCMGCQRAGEVLCYDCAAEIAPAPALPNIGNLSAIAATTVFAGHTRRLIHHLKYGGQINIAPVLAARLANTYQAQGWPADLITAVPLHADRQKKRHYNQAGLLAYHLAQQLAIPYRGQALQRLRATRSQVGLDRASRQANMSGAFAANPAHVAGKTVLLIDDVYTTGATLQACADALLAGQATAVYALTVAYAPEPGKRAGGK